MPEKEKNQRVPESVPRVHEPGHGISEEHARLLDLQVYEMTNNAKIDDSATTPQYPSELGTSSHARSSEPTTSPKILRHDVPTEQLSAAFPDLGAEDREVLLEYVYGKSVLEAASENFVTFDRTKLDEVLAMDYVEAALLCGAEDPVLEDYVPEDEEGDE